MTRYRKSLSNQVVGGLGWSAGFSMGEELLGFAVGVVLARLLMPSEFGCVAMVKVATGFVYVFRDLGLNAALIQRKDVGDDDFSTVFWANLLTGLFFCLALVMIAPFLAGFYGEPALRLMTCVMSVDFILAAPLSIYNAWLSKRLEFKRAFTSRFVGRCIGSLLGICIAFLGGGAWALIFASLASSVVTLVIMTIIVEWRPGFIFSPARLRDFFRFGGLVTADRLVGYWYANVDSLLIGRLLGSGQLGVYRRGRTITEMLTTQIYPAVMPVLFPVLSSIGDQRERLLEAYLRVSRWVIALVMPATIGMAAVAGPFVVGVYGAKWGEAIPILRVLCLTGAVRSLGVVGLFVYLPIGRPGVRFRMSTIDGAFSICATLLGLRFGGVMGLACALFCWAVLWLIPSVVVPLRLVGSGAGVQIRNLRGIIAAALGMGGAVSALSMSSILRSLPELAELVILVSVGVVAYPLLICLFKPTLVQEFRRDLWPTVSQRFGARGEAQNE